MASICSVLPHLPILLWLYHYKERARTNSKLVTIDDQVKAYIKKIMSQLNKWMTGGKISKLVIVITSKETGEHVERWQFDVSSPLLLSNSVGPYLLLRYKMGWWTETNRHFKRSKFSINPAKSPARRNPRTRRTPHPRKTPPSPPFPPTNPFPAAAPPRNPIRRTWRSSEKSNRYSGKSPRP